MKRAGAIPSMVAMALQDAFVYRLRYYRRPDVRKFLAWVVDGNPTIRLGEGGAGGIDLGTLEELSSLGLFHRHVIDTQPLCPRCDSQDFYDRYLCPFCGSPRLDRGKLIEHYPCGFIGPEGEFERGGELVCPKCGINRGGTGADHGRMRGSLKCLDCGRGFAAPLISHICAACGSKFTHEDAHLRHVCEYRFNEALRGEVALACSLGDPISDLLRSKGYRIEDMNSLRGASGAEHAFDVVATRGGDRLVISIASSPSGVGEMEVAGFFAKVFDVRPERALLIAMPKLSEGALRLAKFYGIAVAEGRGAGEIVASMAKLLD